MTLSQAGMKVVTTFIPACDSKCTGATWSVPLAMAMRSFLPLLRSHWLCGCGATPTQRRLGPIMIPLSAGAGAGAVAGVGPGAGAGGGVFVRTRSNRAHAAVETDGAGTALP